jgi:hypothetical protein
MNNFQLSNDTQAYLDQFIHTIRNNVTAFNRDDIILWVDSETELAYINFEYYDENQDAKEIYGGPSRALFNTMLEIRGKDFSTEDDETIDKTIRFIALYINEHLPEFNGHYSY